MSEWRRSCDLIRFQKFVSLADRPARGLFRGQFRLQNIQGHGINIDPNILGEEPGQSFQNPPLQFRIAIRYHSDQNRQPDHETNWFGGETADQGADSIQILMSREEHIHAFRQERIRSYGQLGWREQRSSGTLLLGRRETKKAEGSPRLGRWL